MLTCPTCRTCVPEKLIACPVCTQRRGDKALRFRQQYPLRKILAGDGDLVTRALQGVRHVQMFGADQTFCGLPVQSFWKRNYFKPLTDSPLTLCKSCWAEVEHIAREAEQQATT